MVRRYAAVLGLVAFAVCMVRGIASGGGLEATVGDAIGVMFLLAIVGALAGRIADMIVTEGTGSRASHILSK
jgi:hypothetical protein